MADARSSPESLPPGLVLVPTPLGNLRDVTLRALDVLRACDLIVAEDTRVARRLLNALGIGAKQIWSYREANARTATGPILARAARACVAVVSDAGTPGISDPGRELVASARDAQVAVEVLPGPAAFVCAAVLSGFALDGFTFEGFVPRKHAQRERAFREALASGRTSVWYESPNRIGATLAALDGVDPSARVFLVRELTKLHEQQVLGTAADVSAELAEPVRGEITFVLSARTRAETGRAGEADAEGDIALDRAIDDALAARTAPRTAAKALAVQFGRAANDVYRRLCERRAEMDTRD